jgi:hypothetical protein
VTICHRISEYTTSPFRYIYCLIAFTRSFIARSFVNYFCTRSQRSSQRSESICNYDRFESYYTSFSLSAGTVWDRTGYFVFDSTSIRLYAGTYIDCGITAIRGVYISTLRLGQTTRPPDSPVAMVQTGNRRRLRSGPNNRMPIGRCLEAKSAVWPVFGAPFSKQLQDLGQRRTSAGHQICETYVQNFETRLDTSALCNTYAGETADPSTVSWGKTRDDLEDQRRFFATWHNRSGGAGRARGGAGRETIFTSGQDGLPSRPAFQSTDRSETVLLDFLHSSEAGTKVGPGGSCPGFEMVEGIGTFPKRLCCEVEVSDGWSDTVSIDDNAGRLGHDSRSDRSLYDDSPKSSLQQVNTLPVLQSPGSDHHISDASAMLWTWTGATCVHEILGSNSGLLSDGGKNPCSDFARRYNCGTSVQSDCDTAIPVCAGSSDIFGLHYSQPKVQTITVAPARLVWSFDRHRANGTFSSSEEATRGEPQCSFPHNYGEGKSEHLDAKIRKRGWTTSIVHDDGIKYQTAHAVSDEKIVSPPGGTQLGRGELGQNHPTSDTGRVKRARLVDAPSTQLQWSADTHAATGSDHSLRRFRHRSWADRDKRLPHVRGSSFRRQVDIQPYRATLAHHPQGAFSSAPGHHGTQLDVDVIRGPGTAQLSLAKSHGQQGGRQLCDKAGRQKIGFNAHVKSSVGLVPTASNTAIVRVHEGGRYGDRWSRPPEQRIIYANGMENARQMVPKTGQIVGAAHGGCLRLQNKPPAPTLLLSMERGRGGGSRCAQTRSHGGKLVLQSTTRDDSVPTTLGTNLQLQNQLATQRSGVYTDNSRPSGVVHTNTSCDGGTAASADRRPTVDAAGSTGQASKGAADVMELHGLEAIYEACIHNGLTPTAAQMVLSQWRLDKQLPLHCKTWKKYWISYCEANDIDPYVYTMAEPGIISTSVHLTNCIADAQTAAAERSKEKGKAAQHSILKLIRAAVSAFMQILHPEKPELTFSTYVRKVAKTARLVAPMQKRYSFTFDISLIFNIFCLWYDKGFRNSSMPLKMLRAKSAMLSRIQTSGRSDDLAKVFRDKAKSSATRNCAGLIYDRNGHLRRWRYHRPKNVSSLAGHCSSWVDLGPAVFQSEEDSEKYCTVQCNEIYLERTAELPREPVYLEDGTGYFPFYIAFSKNKNKNYAGIGSQRVAKDILWVMQLSGIDTTQFKAHCVRHASMAAKRDHGVERDIFLASAKMSGEVYDKYYNVPVLHDEYQTAEGRRAHYARQYGQQLAVADAD